MALTAKTPSEMTAAGGLIEQWRRGTNRVAAMRRRHGIAAPEFREAAGAVLVTLRVPLGRTGIDATPQVSAFSKGSRTR